FPTYTQTWNLSLQREVVKNTVLSVSYLGTQITHLQAAQAVNPSIYIPGNGDANGNCAYNGGIAPFKVAAGAPCSTLANTQVRRKLSLLNSKFANELGRISTVARGGTQGYKGMLISVSRRPGHRIKLNAKYTWSHCLREYQ